MFLLAKVKGRLPNAPQPEVNDLRAVWRLAGLYAVLPELREHGDALRAALRRNAIGGLTQVLVALPSRDETSGTPRDNPAHRLALRIFNDSGFSPVQRRLVTLIVVWEARAFEASGSPGLGTKESGTVPPAKRPSPGPWAWWTARPLGVRRSLSPTRLSHVSVLYPPSRERISTFPTRPPRFEIVCHLADGLNRVASGWPRAELADPTTLLTGSASPSSDWPQIRAEAVRTLLPMVELLLADDGIVANHWRLARGLWDSIDDGSMDWVFQGIGAPAKAELCEALAELVWGMPRCCAC